MSLVFRDRVHQQVHPSPPEPVIPGQWVLETAGPVKLNGEPAHGGDYLLPDGRQEWSVAGEQEQFSGGFERKLLPADRVAERLLDIGEEAASALEQPAAWEEFTRLLPIMRRLQERARPQQLEKDLERGLGYLRRVCTRPRLHLKSEQERVPVARARKLPGRATSFLAAHTEDWEARTVLGVQPKRLLAKLTEDQWDIYENRVAVRLVDHLLRDVVERMNEVREILSLYERAAQEFSGTLGGTHWRKERLYELWGQQTEDTEQGRRVAEETLRRLEEQHRALLGLKDTALYSAISPRAQVEAELRRTNILLNDPVYREVAWLWRRRAHWSRQRRLSPREQLERQRKLHLAFERYSLLLTCRVLEHWGFRPRAGGGPRRGQPPLQLEAHDRQAELEWREDGTWVLREQAHGSSVRFVPLLACPVAQGSVEVVDRFLATLKEPQSMSDAATMAPAAAGRVVVLYLGDGDGHHLDPARQRRLNQLGSERRPGEPTGPSLIPISPVDLESEERVGRVLREWWGDSLLPRYPPRLEVARPLLEEVARQQLRWSRVEGQGLNRVLLMVVPPTAREVDEWSGVLESLAQPRGPGRKALASHEQLVQLQRVFTAARQFFTRLLRCPLCSAPAGEFKLLDDGCYRIRCPGCETHWGLKPCSRCKTRIPFLVASGGKLEAVQRRPGWLDRVFGRDVLASPCWREGAREHHICPSCRACPNEGKGQGQCLRCQS